MTKTNTFREHRQRATLEPCDLWDIWSEWWGDLNWPKKHNDKDTGQHSQFLRCLITFLIHFLLFCSYFFIFFLLATVNNPNPHHHHILYEVVFCFILLVHSLYFPIFFSFSSLQLWITHTHTATTSYIKTFWFCWPFKNHWSCSQVHIITMSELMKFCPTIKIIMDLRPTYPTSNQYLPMQWNVFNKSHLIQF